MAKQKLENEIVAATPLDKIKKAIDEFKSFIMMGGAGSGKTYSLLQAIDYAVKKGGKNSVCCVTFTNAAVNEIKHRCPYSGLKVGTIHDVLWDILSPYKKNVLDVFKAMVTENKINIGEVPQETLFSLTEIKYRDYRKLDEGVIWHDDVLKLAGEMFAKYKMLRKIFADKYRYFFIDEYQDTFNVLIDLCSTIIADHKVTIGLFGDSMQSIYENYKSGENKKTAEAKLTEVGFEIIPKTDNYRCSVAVINLINKIRNDNIKQEPVNNNKQGSVKFIYSTSEKPLQEITKNKVFDGWNFSDVLKTKSLLLTHTLISKQLGFENYLKAFKDAEYDNQKAVGKEDERHSIANYLFKVVRLLNLYKTNHIPMFLEASNKKIIKVADKKTIKEEMEKIVDQLNRPCLVVAKDMADKSYIRVKEKDGEKVESLKMIALQKNLENVSMKEVMNAFNYVENMTPFSTQHNIKGLEFENVFVYLDNGRWNNYNFTELFVPSGTKQAAYERTLKLFYVCCSRAKDNLVVYIKSPSKEILTKATEWFGKENVISID